MPKKDIDRLVIDGTSYETEVPAHVARRPRWQPPDPRRVHAQIPAVVTEVRVRPGAEVRRGDALLVLEAMKMKNEIPAPMDGRVQSIHVRLGELVTKHQLLIELE